MKRMCERECLHLERNGLSPDFKESEDAESFDFRNRQTCGPSLEYGNKQSFSFQCIYDGGQNKRKLQYNSKLAVYRKKSYNHLCLLISYPLNPFFIFHTIKLYTF